jgi:hypothetical protein
VADKHPEHQAEHRAEHPQESEAPNPHNTPLVDPRPTAEPIYTGTNDLAAELKAHPAPASPREVLALKPRLLEDALSGPDDQISMIDYTVWTRPNGEGQFIAPVANDQTYERKGYQRGENKRIPDLVAYLADQSKTDLQRRTEQRTREAMERHDRERRAAHDDARQRERELAKEQSEPQHAR